MRSVCVPVELAPLDEELALRGLDVHAASCDLALTIDLSAMPDVPVDWAAHPDGFAWTFTDAHTIAIAARTMRAAHLAAHAIVSSLATLPRSAASWPAFVQRGVIEGFYNRYFTRDERALTLALMHHLDENTYLYAPKDDALGGLRWRDAYEGEAAADLTAAATLATRLGIDFVYGISPTLSTTKGDPSTSLRFSSGDDYAALLAKLRSVQALGVSRFAIQFDDASDSLYHAEDRAAFASLAAAHASLANALLADLGPLYFVGSAYTSQLAGWQGYNQSLGTSLAPGIAVLWTGPDTFSQTITASDLAPIDALLGRQVVLWDNWPLAAMPVEGRSTDLPTATTGLLTNATLVGDFDHPPSDFWKVLGPLSVYAWTPGTYDADADFARWQDVLPLLAACRR